MPDLAITDVRASVVFGRLVFVVVRTDAGITGIGECSPMDPGVLANIVNTVLRPQCLGQDPRHIDRLWSSMYYGTYGLGVAGAQMQAISGVDIALWDILGKATGLPVSVLLGGRYRERVPVYASIGGAAAATPEEMARRIEQALELGYSAVKIRRDDWFGVDRDPRHDMSVFAACRRACGDDLPLGFDANCGYSVPTAIAQGRRLQDMGAAHLEEPVWADDIEGLARVAAALDLPVSAGEQSYTRWQFRYLMASTGVAWVQPDVTKCGGLSEARRIAMLADVHRRALVPHMTLPTIGMAANLHLVASVRDATLPQEFTGQNRRLDELFVEPLEFSGGEMSVPTNPGLGLELDEAAFAAAVASTESPW